MKRKSAKIYRFSDGSAVVTDDVVVAAQHAFCNPGIRCVSVEDRK